MTTDSTNAVSLSMTYAPSTSGTYLGQVGFEEGGRTWNPAPLAPGSQSQYTITLDSPTNAAGMTFRLYNASGSSLLFDVSRTWVFYNPQSSGPTPKGFTWVGNLYNLTVSISLEDLTFLVPPGSPSPGQTLSKIVFTVTNNVSPQIGGAPPVTTANLGLQVLFQDLGSQSTLPHWGEHFTSHDPQIPLEGYVG